MKPSTAEASLARAFVGLGANLGDAAVTVRVAAAQVAALPGVARHRLSPWYRTQPVDAHGPPFVNGVIEIHTARSAAELLCQLQEIEQRHGRERPYRNAPRTLDLDLLWFHGMTIQTPDLIVPHPRLHLRAFALRPLADLDPKLPLAQGSVEELLRGVDNAGLEPL